MFPPGTVLGEICVVQKHKNPYKKEATDMVNAFKKDVLGMTIWWRIAVAGGTPIRQAQDGEDSADLYD